MYLNKILQALADDTQKHKVFIPSAWMSKVSSTPVRIDYKQFLIAMIQEVLDKGPQPTFSKAKNWTTDAVVYNIFPRFFSAYDHDRDGIIGQNKDDITVNTAGIRETGTFLKTIALLPYLKRMGINTLHLLPITRIGIEGRKGDLGSPYAIKNPIEIDPLLADPLIDLDVNAQYSAFLEAAHLMGMKVVQEFIFRTASIDSDWSKENPHWFYWIDKNVNYQAPKFNQKDLKQILKVPKGKGKYIPPPKAYRRKFNIPMKGPISKDWKVASAFADWPPDDLQPSWSDVTYLRLYNYDYDQDNNYNYIAYNTVRYYDPKLAHRKNINHELWDKISSIIPYYQKKFGIDGAMIDMGHALPYRLKQKIIDEARKHDDSFAFWDENFSNKEETKKEGYNAVVGDSWSTMTKRNGIKKAIMSAEKPKPLPFFGTPETHNSPRFGNSNLARKKAAWLLFNIIPGAVPFLHNGYELNEQLPVNTGLNFKEHEIKHFSKKRLPLFYKNAMNWDTRSGMQPFIQKLAGIKKRYPFIFDKKLLSILKSDNPKVLGFKTTSKGRNAIVLFNTNFHKKEVYEVSGMSSPVYVDLLSEKKINFSGSNTLSRGGILLALGANQP
jgi:hypothetical protein